MRSIIHRADNILSSVLIIIGVGAFVLAFFTPPVMIQIAVGLAGLGFISLGLAYLKVVRDNREFADKLERIISRLDEIKQELDSIEKPKGAGIAIADVISSGLKYYAEHLNKDNVKED